MKALELLKEMRNTENNYDHLISHRFDEAIKELEEAQQYAQRVQELETYCEEQKDTWEAQANDDHKVYEKILTKLRS